MPARATWQELGFGMGVARVGDEGTGLSMAGTWAFQRRWVSLTLVPIDIVVLPQPADARYRRETFSDGGSVCRDTETGRFADDAMCAADVAFGAAAEAGVRLPLGTKRALVLGGGYRAGETNGPYVAVTLDGGSLGASRWQVRGRFSGNLIDLGVGGVLSLRR